MPNCPVREPLPRFVEPMLARAANLPGDEAGWAVEVKWDGIRGQLRVDGKRWCVRSRPGRDVTEAFPELAELAHALRHRRVVLDGELVHLGGDGKPDFAAVRRRLATGKRPPIATAAVTYLAFDVLHLDGRAVRELPYVDRRALLAELVEAQSGWWVSEYWVERIADVVQTSREHGLEGVVCKRLDARYEAGRRTGSWLKHKHRRRELLAVTAWTPGDGEPDTIYVARTDAHGGRTRAGSVQLGLSRHQREHLRAALAERELPAPLRRRIRSVAPGIRVVVDAHGSPSGPVRDPILRDVLLDTSEGSQALQAEPH